METHLCWTGRAAYRQLETSAAESSIRATSRNRHSRWRDECARYHCATRRFRPIQRIRPIRRVRSNGTSWRNPGRCSGFGHESSKSCESRKRCQPFGRDGNSCFRRSGHRYQWSTDSDGRHSYHHGWKHYWGRQQDQPKVRRCLRTREKLPPVRIYLGSVEGHIRNGPARHADRNGAGATRRPAAGTESLRPAAWAAWSESVRSAARAESYESAAESSTTTAKPAATKSTATAVGRPWFNDPKFSICAS